MRGCKGCCVELGDVVKMIRKGEGPVALRFFEPPGLQLSAVRSGKGGTSPVRSADGGGQRPMGGQDAADFQVAASPSMSRLSWIGNVAQRASAGDVDATYKLGVDHVLRVAED